MAKAFLHPSTQPYMLSQVVATYRITGVFAQSLTKVPDAVYLFASRWCYPSYYAAGFPTSWPLTARLQPSCSSAPCGMCGVWRKVWLIFDHLSPLTLLPCALGHAQSGLVESTFWDINIALEVRAPAWSRKVCERSPHPPMKMA